MSKKIVVLCPGWAKTGGPEALHQLVNKIDANICYYGERNDIVIGYYKNHYNVREAKISDIKDNILVFPEVVDPKYAVSLGASGNWVWWLSANRNYPARDYAGIGNLCQSEYAASIVRLLNGKFLYLTDYISNFHAEESSRGQKKKDIIVYGPKSAFFAFLLKATDSRLPLEPIIGKGKDQTIKMLSSSKMYIDFGWHQGRDRMPREAALYNCLVIMDRLGAADNDVDYPLKDEYKLDIEDIKGAAVSLKKYLKEYDERITDFSAYKDWIKKQEAQFTGEAEEFTEKAEEPSSYSNGILNEDIDRYVLLKQRESFYHRRVNELMSNKVMRGGSLALRLLLNRLKR
ncbi:MAG: hypothetical protein WC491_02110 [Candidatus Omnitrophota bacterium]